MNKLNRLCSVALLFAASAICACCTSSKEGSLPEYSISGTFNVPDSVLMGDSLVALGSPDGGCVYLLDIQGEVLDSSLVFNNSFSFSGEVDSLDSYFAYLASDWGFGMLVIEPGEISVEMTGENPIVSGTPLNDGVTDLELFLSYIEEDFYGRLLRLYNDEGNRVDSDDLMSVYREEVEAKADLLDSVYQANAENLLGVYATLRIVEQTTDLEQFNMVMNQVTDYVRNHPMILRYKEYLLSFASE